MLLTIKPFFDDIPKSEINDTPNALEVTDVPGDYSGADLACQAAQYKRHFIVWASLDPTFQLI